MEDIVISSFNVNKINEFNDLLKFKNINDFKFVTIKDIIKDEKIKPPNETGHSLEDNALIKLKFAMNLIKDKIIISDDSGFFIESLNGKPGIYASRFGGDIDDKSKNKMILELMKNKKNRNAYYKTVICCHIPGYDWFFVEKNLKGLISKEIKGSNGFAYDSIFYISYYNKTIAQMDNETIINIIPRTRAILDTIEFIRDTKKIQVVYS